MSLMSRIYIETTIPSFYFEVRKDSKNAARREWTRLWFDTAIRKHHVLSSAAVTEELERGQFPGKIKALDLINRLDALAIDENVIEIVEEYVRHKLMPRDPSGDAMHLALASY